MDTIIEMRENQAIELAKYATFNQSFAHEKCSKRYEFISTKEVLNCLNDKGWELVNYSEAKTRKPSLVGYQKHLMRLRNPKLDYDGEQIPEIVVVNGHAANSSVKLMLGCYRIVCSNGMIAGETFDNYRICHMKYDKPDVEMFIGKDGVYRAIDSLTQNVPMLMNRIQKMKTIEVPEPKAIQFALDAFYLKHNQGNAILRDVQDLVYTHRAADRGDDLWHVFNRVQENLMKGQYQLVSQRKGETVCRKARPVRSIPANVAINKGLWNMAEALIN